MGVRSHETAVGVRSSELAVGVSLHEAAVGVAGTLPDCAVGVGSGEAARPDASMAL